MYTFEKSTPVKQKILILNGPNLNLIGSRQTEIYGEQSFEEFLTQLRNSYPDLQIDYNQSNIEGELIDKIQSCDSQYTGVVLNAGGYTHSSVAIADAIFAISIPVIEVHISQPKTRERERYFSLIEKACVGTISGFGLSSYKLAVEHLANDIK